MAKSPRPKQTPGDPAEIARFVELSRRNWAAAIDAVHRAAVAIDALAASLARVPDPELGQMGAAGVAQDIAHVLWATRLHLSVLNGPCPAEVSDLVESGV